MITQEKLKSLVYYCAKTGGLYWIADYKRKNKANNRCGFKHSRGYRHVLIECRQYKEHVLIWIYHNGEIPLGYQIDREKQIRDMNFIWNLRLTTGFQNQQNRGKNKNNTIGYKGVERCGSGYIAIIMANRNRIKSILCSTKEQAALEYNKLAVMYHKEFANLNILLA